MEIETHEYLDPEVGTQFGTQVFPPKIDEIKTLAKGTIFTAINVTKKGQRKFICRLGVRKHLKGGELPYNPAEKDLLTVFDMQKREYRAINLKTLKYLRIRNRVLINLLQTEI